MAIYRWRIPAYKALQFDGKNKKAIKELVGDDSDKEDVMLHTGKYEEPKKDKEAKPDSAGGGKTSKGMWSSTSESEAAEPASGSEEPKEILKKLEMQEGDWITRDVGTGKIEVNPKDFPEKFEYVA